MRRAWNTIKRFLTRPVFGTRVIPRDARVDPTEFPQDEFPTWCMKCGYSLHGLPENICPECGTAFDRGHLLVQEYVLRKGALPWKRSGPAKLANLRLIIGVVLIFAKAILLQFLRLQQARLWVASLGSAYFTMWFFVGIQLLPYLLIFASILIGSNNWRERARKRRAVLDQIPRN